MSSGGSHG
jgi:formyltetrahydrofolate synthetase